MKKINIAILLVTVFTMSGCYYFKSTQAKFVGTWQCGKYELNYSSDQSFKQHYSKSGNIVEDKLEIDGVGEKGIMRWGTNNDNFFHRYRTIEFSSQYAVLLTGYDTSDFQLCAGSLSN